MMRLTEDSVLKSLLMTDLYFFTRYFYHQRTGNKFIHGDHFKTISDVLEKVYTHEITRLIINLPPRHGKTEQGVINFIAKGLMINPKAKFIHTSYSDSLALENSDKIRDIIKSDAFQRLSPIKIKTDTDSKAKWYTEQGGGVYATSSGGAITGFGAGIIGSDEFGGAIIIDDPLKPTDAYSTMVRTSVNDRFDNTIISRCNNPKTPIIVIMQRLHSEDLSGVLLKRGGWHHLNLPAIHEDGSYLWDYKKDTVDEIKETAPYVFFTQYQQQPTDKEVAGLFFHSFDEEKHYRLGVTYTAGVYLDISFDFNKKPCTAVVGQFNTQNLEFKKFDVIEATNKTYLEMAQTPKSALEMVCYQINAKYINSGLFTTTQIRVTGDASGNNGGADVIDDVVDIHGMYTTIVKELKIKTHQVFIRKSNTTHIFSGELCNKVYRLLNKDQFIIGHPKIKAEIEMAYEDEKKSLNEAKDKLGLHTIDATRYLDDFWFCCHGGRFTSDMRIIGQYIDSLKSAFKIKHNGNGVLLT